VELWAEDECRLGLKPAARRVWVPKGTRPLCNGQHRFQWLYVYGFAEPSTGRTVCLLLPRANTERMSEALAEFARQADPEQKKLIVLLVDNAGWHTSRRLAVPANVVLHRLPPCTPELQPVEPLWPLLREAVANRTLADLAELEERVRRRAGWLANNRAVAKGAVGFHWAVKIAG
jgi:transposase